MPEEAAPAKHAKIRKSCNGSNAVDWSCSSHEVVDKGQLDKLRHDADHSIVHKQNRDHNNVQQGNQRTLCMPHAGANETIGKDKCVCGVRARPGGNAARCNCE